MSRNTRSNTHVQFVFDKPPEDMSVKDAEMFLAYLNQAKKLTSEQQQQQQDKAVAKSRDPLTLPVILLSAFVGIVVTLGAEFGAELLYRWWSTSK